MKEKLTPKYPHSVQLFKLCSKILQQQKNTNVKDSEVGEILGYNSSDCSHWKRGVKNVKSVFELNRLSEALGINIFILHDVVYGNLDAEQAFFEYQESRFFNDVIKNIREHDLNHVKEVESKVLSFAQSLHEKANFSTPPLYIPEILRLFDFISTQSVEISTKLSRILKLRPGEYAIQYKRGELTADVRYSMLKDVAKIIFEAERNRFTELSGIEWNEGLLNYAEILWVTNLLIPPGMLIEEMSKLEVKRNMINELSSIFWAPKFIVNFQIRNIINTKADMVGIEHSNFNADVKILEQVQNQHFKEVNI